MTRVYVARGAPRSRTASGLAGAGANPVPVRGAARERQPVHRCKAFEELELRLASPRYLEARR